MQEWTSAEVAHLVLSAERMHISAVVVVYNISWNAFFDLTAPLFTSMYIYNINIKI